MLNRLRPRANPTTLLRRRQHLQCQNEPQCGASPHRPQPQPAHLQQKRTLIAAPKPGSGPLMSRRPDRALPSLDSIGAGGGMRRWLRTLPLFAAAMIASALAIFNYQKTSSSVVSSALYALRTNPTAREILGEEIYFASQIPWISGELNQLHGRIDISFWVKGSRAKGLMRFKSVRKERMGFFETVEWSLEPEGAAKISLLEAEGRDPFHQETADKIAVIE